MQNKLADETATTKESMCLTVKEGADIEGRFGTEKSNNNSDN